MELIYICRHHREEWQSLAVAHCHELSEGKTAPELDDTFESYFLPASSQDRCVCLVAIEDGKVVGFINIQWHRMPFWKGPMLYVADLYVDEPYRRRGIGTSMLNKAIELGHRTESVYIWWMTKADSPARALYDKFAAGHSVAMYVGFLGWRS